MGDCARARGFKFTARNYFVALLVAFSYASLSVLILDLLVSIIQLSLLPSAAQIYIGAKGLTDAIFLSGLLAPFSVTLATFSTIFAKQVSKLSYWKYFLKEKSGNKSSQQSGFKLRN